MTVHFYTLCHLIAQCGSMTRVMVHKLVHVSLVCCSSMQIQGVAKQRKCDNGSHLEWLEEHWVPGFKPQYGCIFFSSCDIQCLTVLVQNWSHWHYAHTSFQHSSEQIWWQTDAAGNVAQQINWQNRCRDNLGSVKWKSAFEHAQNVQIQVILNIHKVSLGPLLSIDTFYHLSLIVSYDC